jgi:hypothetical protein
VSAPIKRVRIRRVVVRGAASDQHDIDQLPRVIAGALSGSESRGPSPARGVGDVASSVAAQVAVAGRLGGDS